MTSKHCVVCGQQFQAKRKDQRYHGVACRVRASRIRKGIGVRLPRTKRGRAEKLGRLFGVAAKTLAVAALARKLEQVLTERDEAIAALKREQANTPALRSDNERQRTEFEERSAQERVAHDKEIVDTITLYEGELRRAEERYRHELTETVNAAAERQRVAFNEAQAKAHKELEQVSAQVRDLSGERARVVEEKRQAEAANQALLQEKRELRRQLADLQDERDDHAERSGRYLSQVESLRQFLFRRDAEREALEKQFTKLQGEVQWLSATDQENTRLRTQLTEATKPSPLLEASQKE